MGIFNKIFGGSDASETPQEQSNIAWKPLTHVDQLQTIVQDSHHQAIAIFKHSTRCGISRMVIKQFESDFNIKEDELQVYYLDLLNYRSISDEIAATFQVWHESPQLIVVKNGVTVAHASHSGINALDLKNFI